MSPNIEEAPLDLAWILNGIVTMPVLLVGALTIWSACRLNCRFWLYFSALALATILPFASMLVNWFALKSAVHDYRLLVGAVHEIEEMRFVGDYYLRQLNLVFLGLIGFLVMIVSLCIKIPLQQSKGG